jgi:hypothetical protein
LPALSRDTFLKVVAQRKAESNQARQRAEEAKANQPRQVAIQQANVANRRAAAEAARAQAMAFWTSFLTLDISPSSLFWPVALSGAALPLVFISLSGVAFGTLKKAQIGGASGLFNLLRNIGGSIGIAAANTIAARHLQTHRGELTRSLTGASVQLQRQISQLTTRMHLHAGPGVAARRAFSIVQRSLDQQAQLLAYATTSAISLSSVRSASPWYS